MAIRVPIVSDFDEGGVKRALQSFERLKTEIGKADGAFNKFKVASGAAFDFAKQNAIAFATAAAAAVATFVAKSVSNYAKLTLEIGRFSDATRVSMEDSSRLIEVVNDLGIETGSLETSLVKMSKAVASGSDSFKLIGAEIYRTSTGAVDVTRTFYNVIDALRNIEDPALRAKAASDILGKGWASMAELIENGSASLKKSMDEVASTKVFDGGDRRRAEDFRNALDRLKDSVEGFSREVGQYAIPAVTDLLNKLAALTEAAQNVASFEVFGRSVGDIATTLGRFGFGALSGAMALKDLIFGAEESIVVTEEMAVVWRDGYQAMIDAKYASGELTGSLYGQQTALDIISAAWDEYLGYLDVEQTFLQAQQNVADFSAKWEEAVKDGTANAKEWLIEIVDLQTQIIGIAQKTEAAKNLAAQNVIKILVNTWQLERALMLLDQLRKGQVGIVPGAVISPYGAMPTTGSYLPFGIPQMAEGGIVSGPTMALIGEAGPEAVIPLDRLGTMGGITVNVTGSVVTENDLIDSIRKGLANAQRNGSQLVYSNL